MLCAATTKKKRFPTVADVGDNEQAFILLFPAEVVKNSLVPDMFLTALLIAFDLGLPKDMLTTPGRDVFLWWSYVRARPGNIQSKVKKPDVVVI